MRTKTLIGISSALLALLAIVFIADAGRQPRGGALVTRAEAADSPTAVTSGPRRLGEAQGAGPQDPARDPTPAPEEGTARAEEPRDVEQESSTAVPEEVRRAQAEEYLAILMDPRNTHEERRDAFTLLEFFASHYAIDLRTPEALEIALWILETAAEEKVREGVIGGFEGVRDAEVVRRFVGILASDPSGLVRQEVASELLDHLDEEGVREALRRAARDDPDERVREYAARAK